jgi:hypothetical protein
LIEISNMQVKLIVIMISRHDAVHCPAAGFGALSSLVKLQASFNPFETLPADMFQLPRLEMFRLAVGALDKWPAGLLQSGIGVLHQRVCGSLGYEGRAL